MILKIDQNTKQNLILNCKARLILKIPTLKEKEKSLFDNILR